jgi:hypothetical protein
VENVVFENLEINGKKIASPGEANLKIGDYVSRVEFK